MEKYASAFPPGFLKGDIKVNTRGTSARHLIFATDTQLKILKKFQKAFGDGTFHVSPIPFVQLFSLHAFISYEKSLKQVPLVFVFMSRRTAEDYEAVFKHIVKLCQSDEQDKEPLNELKEVVCDFERAIWKAVRKVFPNVTLRGCGFHLRQAIF